MRIPMERLNADVLQTLQTKVLQPSVIVEAVRQALEEMRPSQTDQAMRRESITQQIATLDLELRHYGEAIATAGALPSILSSIQEREHARPLYNTNCGNSIASIRSAELMKPS